ncbi:Lrp/AsnC family transcriptional regulator [Mesoterricola silvestris]|uniref:Lrp-family transcriptional regulator n=1 Tax=Mesoterricola silvestris TaxID=2927979 RepID=A0AA48GML1_9BACT|nr:Lrp/AsnC family transcriptional regulator [Mesoterricola silvestris]BDU72280.1 Lrp-family transcriptional regulator [Mesoterricola silvestris]
MSKLKIDKINEAILGILQTRARITNQELADAIGLSPSAVLLRVRKLEAAGVISRYVADINIQKLADAAEYYVEITLTTQGLEERARFEKAMLANPFVIRCNQVAGPIDYLLQVMTLNTHHFERLADWLLSGDLPVQRITSIPIMRKVKPYAGFPIPAFFAGESPQE